MSSKSSDDNARSFKNKILGWIITILSCIVIILFIYDKITFDFIDEYYSITTIDEYKEYQNNRYVKDVNSFASIPEYYFGGSRAVVEITDKQEYDDGSIIVKYIVKDDMYNYYSGADLWKVERNNLERMSNIYLISGML